MSTDAGIPKNPIIFKDQSEWIFSENVEVKEIKSRLEFSRECELAVENYEFQRHNSQLIEQNKRLRNQITRVRTALRDSTQLVATLQAQLTKQSKHITRIETENSELMSKIADANLTNKCLSTGYSKQKKAQYVLCNETVALKKDVEKTKRRMEESAVKSEKEHQRNEARLIKELEKMQGEKNVLLEKMKKQQDYYENADKTIEGLNSDVTTLRKKLKGKTTELQTFVDNVKETKEYQELSKLYESLYIDHAMLKSDLEQKNVQMAKMEARNDDLYRRAEAEGLHIPRGSFSFDE